MGRRDRVGDSAVHDWSTVSDVLAGRQHDSVLFVALLAREDDGGVLGRLELERRSERLVVDQVRVGRLKLESKLPSEVAVEL